MMQTRIVDEDARVASADDISTHAGLARVLNDAFNQAANGKGKERHGNGKPFEHQPLFEISRMVGIGGPAYQVMKKTQEAVTMFVRGQHDAAIRELHGAIVYAAATIMLIEESKKDKADD